MTLGSLVLGLCLMLVFLILNGMFVAFEYAIVAIRKSRIEEMVQSGHPGAARIQKLKQELDRTISGSQLGITLCSLAIGWLGDHSILPLIKSLLSFIPSVAAAELPAGLGVALSFVVLSMLHVIIGEQVPKTLALRMPERITLLLVIPYKIFTVITLPLVYTMSRITALILWLLGQRKIVKNESQLPSEAEFQILFEESVKAGTLGKQESDFLKRALELKALTVREVMIPRTRMDCVEDGQSLKDLMAIVSRTKHSKLPVYRGTRDNVIGVLNTRDLFDVWHSLLKANDKPVESRGKEKPFRLTDYIRQAYFVPETKLASTLLEEMKARKLQMAVVLDEFGATVGLVTLEDLVEQLVGEIWDEYDGLIGSIEKLSEDTWRVPGEMTLFEFNRNFGSDLSCESHCVTVAGAVIEVMDRQPVVGESAELGGYRFTVVDIAGRAVTRLEVKRLPEPGTALTDEGPAEPGTGGPEDGQSQN